MQCLLVLLPATAETCQLGYAEKPEEELREPSRQHWTEQEMLRYGSGAAVAAKQHNDGYDGKGSTKLLTGGAPQQPSALFCYAQP